MEALMISISIICVVLTIVLANTLWEVRSLQTELQLSARTHALQLMSISEKHSVQLHDLAVTMLAQSKATNASEALDIHQAVQAGRAPPEPIEHVPPPAKGIKLREGLEIDFITPPTEAQMAEVDEDMVLR